MMLKALSSTFDMTDYLHTLAMYDTPMNVTISTVRISSTKYIPRDSSTYLNPESSRSDITFTDIYLFGSDTQWRLDHH